MGRSNLRVRPRRKRHRAAQFHHRDQSAEPGDEPPGLRVRGSRPLASETRTINGVAYVTGYSYDGSGRLSGMTYPSGRTITYAFDAARANQQVSTTPQGGAQQTVVSNITYQPSGGVKSYTLGNGQTYTRGYDLDGRIASYSLGSQFLRWAMTMRAASPSSTIRQRAELQHLRLRSTGSADERGAAESALRLRLRRVGNRSSKTGGLGDRHLHLRHDEQSLAASPHKAAPRAILASIPMARPPTTASINTSTTRAGDSPSQWSGPRWARLLTK